MYMYVYYSKELHAPALNPTKQIPNLKVSKTTKRITNLITHIPPSNSHIHKNINTSTPSLAHSKVLHTKNIKETW